MISVRTALLAASVTISAPFAQAQTFSIAANPQGSLLYSTAAALAKVSQDKVGIQFRVVPFGGSSTYIPLVNKGEVEFGLANGGEWFFAHRGIEIFKDQPNPNVRMIARLYSIDGNFAVRTDSPIKRIRDLKDRRVPSDFTAGIVFHYLTAALLATEGLTYEDVRKLPVPNFIAGVKSLQEGKVESAYIPLNSAVGREAMASMAGGWRYVTFEHRPDSDAKLGRVFPFSTANVVQPAPDMIGVAAPTSMIQVWTYLAANASVPDEAVYKITKTIYENKPALVAAFGSFRQLSQDGMADGHSNPWHPGAVRFYTEVGRWKEPRR